MGGILVHRCATVAIEAKPRDMYELEDACECLQCATSRTVRENVYSVSVFRRNFLTIVFLCW